MKTHITFHLVTLFLAFMAGVAPAEERNARFITLAGHPGAEDMVIAYRMSADGDVVVGEAPTDAVHGEGAVAERRRDGSWTVRRTGFFAVRQSNESPALGVSKNGRVVVGFGSYGNPEVAMPWASFDGGPLTALGLLSGDITGLPFDASTHGQCIVGWGSTGTSDRFGSDAPFRHALLWTQTGATPAMIDPPPAGPVDSTAVAIAQGGRIIVGFAQSARSATNHYLASDARGHEAIVWTRHGHKNYERQFLGALPDHPFYSRAVGISQDGERITGISGVTDDRHAVLWTLAHHRNHLERFEIQDLGTLPGYTASGAEAISADGRVVVGSCSSDVNGDFVAVAFIWDEQHGMRDLAAFLGAHGATISPDLTLVSGNGLSRDGRHISGYAYDLDFNLLAWVAELPRNLGVKLE